MLQGSILGPQNDISTVASHKVKLFADGVIVYKEISSHDDAALLQLDLSSITKWEKKWLLHLNPLKCDSITISYKHSPPIIPSELFAYFTSFCSTLPWHFWNEYCKYVSANATKSPNFLHHYLYNSSVSLKSITYKCIVHPVLEYTCHVWQPFAV